MNCTDCTNAAGPCRVPDNDGAGSTCLGVNQGTGACFVGTEACYGPAPEPATTEPTPAPTLVPTTPVPTPSDPTTSEPTPAPEPATTEPTPALTPVPTTQVPTTPVPTPSEPTTSEPAPLPSAAPSPSPADEQVLMNCTDCTNAAGPCRVPDNDGAGSTCLGVNQGTGACFVGTEACYGPAPEPATTEPTPAPTLVPTTPVPTPSEPTPSEPTTSEPTPAPTPAPTTPVPTNSVPAQPPTHPDCENCREGTAGPCFTQTPMGIACLGIVPETGQCVTGSFLCAATTTTIATTTEETTAASGGCGGCALGTAGPCFQTLDDGTKYCLGYVPNTNGCYVGMNECGEAVTTQEATGDDCASCDAGAGPCARTLGDGSTYCLGYIPNTEGCYTGTANCGETPIVTTEAATDPPIEPCEDCTTGLGPCGLLTTVGKVCLEFIPSTTSCYQGTLLCMGQTSAPTSATTPPVPTLRPTVSPPAACTGCMPGTFGACMHEPSTYCLEPLSGTTQCLRTTTLCEAFQTTPGPDNCPECAPLSGGTQCHHAGSGLCLDFFPGTSSCPPGMDVRVCLETTQSSVATTVTVRPGPTTTYIDDVFVWAYWIEFENSNPRLGFSTVVDSAHRLFSLTDAPLDDCKRMCTLSGDCLGIFEFGGLDGGRKRCIGLDDLGISAVVSLHGASNGVSYRKMPRTTPSPTTLEPTTVPSAVPTSSEPTAAPTMMPTFPALYNYAATFSSTNTVVGTRFAAAFSASNRIFGIVRGQVEGAVQASCEEHCSAAYGCMGVFVWQAGLRFDNEAYIATGDDFLCTGLRMIGGAPKLMDTYSVSYVRERLWDRCSFGFTGPCKHMATNFCMESMPFEDNCLPGFERAPDILPATEAPSPAPTPAPAPTTLEPMPAPTPAPTTAVPTAMDPTTSMPTSRPSPAPSPAPTTAEPITATATFSPTTIPSMAPTTSEPTPTTPPYHPTVASCDPDGLDNPVCASFDIPTQCASGLALVCPVTHSTCCQ